MMMNQLKCLIIAQFCTKLTILPPPFAILHFTQSDQILWIQSSMVPQFPLTLTFLISFWTMYSSLNLFLSYFILFT